MRTLLDDKSQMLERIIKIQSDVVQSMSEGIIIISFDGVVLYGNDAATEILNIPKGELIGRRFAALFFNGPENDRFTQAVLDAVYSKEQPSDQVIPFWSGGQIKYLRVVTFYFAEEGSLPAGISILVSDLSEIMELRDSVKAMDQIRDLNRQLNERNALLSKTFGQFLSDDIVRELLEKPGGLELGGKKRTVTIMMSDLRGFTAMSEKMDAGCLIAMLNHYLEKMTDIIQKRGGTIIEFIGDGILAIFGAPVHSDHHAAQAVAAALEMQRAMEEVNEWNAQREYPRLEMGIGIDTGEVILGNIGSEKRMKYGVVGSHVNLCGRIESYTIGGQVLISSDTRKQVSATLQVEKEIRVLPKGASDEIILSQITGIGEPYGIFVNMHNDTMQELPQALPVAFSLIDEKHTQDTILFGGIIAAGRDCAILKTQAPLGLYDNIQIKAGGRLLCKVMEERADGFFIQYTSIPHGYGKWFEKTMEAADRGYI